MTHARLHAPAENGAILIDPPLDEAIGLISSNQQRFASWTYDFQGRAAGRVRAMTRAAVLSAATEYVGANNSPQRTIRNAESPLPDPFIVSGHQPELFHPGVWVKNFAAHAIARRVGGVPLHLIVDTDTVKRTTERVPTGRIEAPSVVHVPIDRWPGEIPFEEYVVRDEAAFESFGTRVCDIMRPLGIEPVAKQFWRLAVDAGGTRPRLSDRLAQARRLQEAAWGCPSSELPVSRLCQTEGFWWFASHVLARLPAFCEVYNTALDEYRRLHRIRSRLHPMPSLARDGDWLEAPFRVWTANRPRRLPLFARQEGREMLLTDRDQWTARLPLAPDREACCAVEALMALARSDVKLRTRALTTTIFTRLCLADLFIHGLGGALYDKVADAIIERFFGLEPPRFLILTGTLHLPITSHAFTGEHARELKRSARDLVYNPDRHLPAATAATADVARLVEQKQKLLRQEPETRRERRERFEQLRHLNDLLAPAVADLRDRTRQQLQTVEAALAANAILRNREWAFCIYPEAALKAFLKPFLA